jgi:hypothetical protein
MLHKFKNASWPAPLTPDTIDKSSRLQLNLLERHSIITVSDWQQAAATTGALLDPQWWETINRAVVRVTQAAKDFEHFIQKQSKECRPEDPVDDSLTKLTHHHRFTDPETGAVTAMLGKRRLKFVEEVRLNRGPEKEKYPVTCVIAAPRQGKSLFLDMVANNLGRLHKDCCVVRISFNSKTPFDETLESGSLEGAKCILASCAALTPHDAKLQCDVTRFAVSLVLQVDRLSICGTSNRCTWISNRPADRYRGRAVGAVQQYEGSELREECAKLDHCHVLQRLAHRLWVPC